MLCRAVLCCAVFQAESVGEQLALLEAEITPIRRALGEAGKSCCLNDVVLFKEQV
jgi:hypothetical protein